MHYSVGTCSPISPRTEFEYRDNIFGMNAQCIVFRLTSLASTLRHNSKLRKSVQQVPLSTPLLYCLQCFFIYNQYNSKLRKSVQQIYRTRKSVRSFGEVHQDRRSSPSYLTTGKLINLFSCLKRDIGPYIAFHIDKYILIRG